MSQNYFITRFFTGIDGFFTLTLLTMLILSGMYMSCTPCVYCDELTFCSTSLVASAIFQSSTFGFAGVFPFKYTSVVLSGQVS